MKHIVLLHGWAMNSAVFDELSALLSRDFLVSAPDLSGYGDSRACEPYALENLAGEISGCAPKRCYVAGWSLGAQVALSWVCARPEQVERIALLGATPSFVQREGWKPALEPAVMQAFRQALAQDSDRTLRRFIVLQARGDAAEKRVVQRLRAVLAGQPTPATSVLDEGLRILCESDLRGIAGAVAQRALVVHGERDELVPLAGAEQLADMLPHARCEVIPDAAHAFFISHPDVVARLLMEHFHER
jgi:pimeloyl-[acyl-carrier protein] methyl ester esterase